MAAARGGRSSSLGGLTVQQLERELGKRRRKLPTLQRKRAGLQRKRAGLVRRLSTIERKLAGVESRISGLGAAGRRGGGRRPRGAPTLVSSLIEVLKGKTMSVKDAMEAVRGAGYKTSSPNFRVMVNQAFIARKNKKFFKRVDRGLYTTA